MRWSSSRGRTTGRSCSSPLRRVSSRRNLLGPHHPDLRDVCARRVMLAPQLLQHGAPLGVLRSTVNRRSSRCACSAHERAAVRGRGLVAPTTPSRPEPQSARGRALEDRPEMLRKGRNTRSANARSAHIVLRSRCPRPIPAFAATQREPQARHDGADRLIAVLGVHLVPRRRLTPGRAPRANRRSGRRIVRSESTASRQDPSRRRQRANERLDFARVSGQHPNTGRHP